MKTDEEIVANIKRIYPNEYCNDTQVEVRRIEDDVYVKITQMYNAPQHNLSMHEFAKQMVEAVGMDDFCEHDDINNGGCETCDYGSSYGTEFRFFNRN